MEQNVLVETGLLIFSTVSELPQAAFETVKGLNKNYRYNFPARYGVDIFGDAAPGQMEKAVEEFRAKQKQIRGIA